VPSGWLSAVGFWELSVGCWVLAAAALCWLAGWLAGCLVIWLSGCLAVWLSGCLAGRGRQGGRAGARERGRERERAERQDGGKGSGRGGGRQGRRAEPPEAPWWSRAEQARQRNGAHVVECPGLVLFAPLVREQDPFCT
jgi:hypothetical protein